MLGGLGRINLIRETHLNDVLLGETIDPTLGPDVHVNGVIREVIDQHDRQLLESELTPDVITVVAV